MDDPRASGRPCVVTGAASGIGRAVAVDLLAAGWNVAFIDLVPVTSPDGPAMTIRCDVTDEAAVTAAFDAVRERFGAPVWACFANAGVSGGSDGFVDVSLAHFRDIVTRNLTGCFLTMREAARAMTAAGGGGRIVATASVAGLRGSFDTGTPYAAAKAGIINMVQQAAIRLAPQGITVNAICPGPVETGAGGGALHDPSVAAALARNVPMGRIGRPAEIAGLARLFASVESSFITGQIVAVDGGMSAFGGRLPS